MSREATRFSIEIIFFEEKTSIYNTKQMQNTVKMVKITELEK